MLQRVLKRMLLFLKYDIYKYSSIRKLATILLTVDKIQVPYKTGTVCNLDPSFTDFNFIC